MYFYAIYQSFINFISSNLLIFYGEYFDILNMQRTNVTSNN
jgi:hypothetical protein